MRNRNLGATAAVALSLAAVSFGGVSNADPANAMSTLSDLQSKGYIVFINKMGGVKPLSQCNVVGVKPGQMVTRMDSGSGQPGSSSDIITTSEVMTVYVDVQC